MWLAAATLQIRSCCSCIEKIRSWQCETRLEYMTCSPLPDELKPEFLVGQHWLAKRCSTCQWSAIVVCRFILHDSSDSTCEQNGIIKKCTGSCLWKVTRILKLQTLYQTLERTAGHSPETQGGWPQVCRKTLRLRMQPSPDISCLWKVSIWPRWCANALLANFSKLAVWICCEKNAEFGACFCCSEFI